uniref:Nuclear pore protein n=1 Tax=Panagrellus redivivus TaxID=6233 RepID=A0A7E4V0N0_PANRE
MHVLPQPMIDSPRAAAWGIVIALCLRMFLPSPAALLISLFIAFLLCHFREPFAVTIEIRLFPPLSTMSNDFSALLNASSFDGNVSMSPARNKINQSQLLETSISSPTQLNQFQDIFKSSEEIWNRKQLKNHGPGGDAGPRRPTASIFSSSKNSTKQAVPSSGGYKDNYSTDSYNVVSGAAITGLVEQSVHRARLEAERVFLNQHVLESNNLRYGRSRSPNTSNAHVKDFGSSLERPKSKHLKPLDNFVENVFAKKVEQALSSPERTAGLLPALKSAVLDAKDPAIEVVWDKIFALCKGSLKDSNSSVAEFRMSKDWMRHVVEAATGYLQAEYKRHMEEVIELNLEIAQRGGVPGTLSLIEAYLNVAKLSSGLAENELFNRHPVWCVLFHALRLGDYTAAGTIANSLLNSPTNSILVQVVNALAKNVMIDHQTRHKLYAEWTHEEHRCTDIFKRAVYGLLLDLDCTDVNDSIENWLWAKLVSVKLDVEHGFDRFQSLQRLVSLEYGEDYFLDEENGGAPLLYFSALLLTGQLERAIEILHRFDMPVFATHLAILAYVQNLIILTEKVSDEILTPDPSDQTACRINFARIVIMYVKRFEMVNVSFALNYCFFLNELYFDGKRTEDKGSLFEACVSRLVYVTGEADSILGRMTNEGVRSKGLIDRFASEINVNDVIARIALDTSLNGDNLTAGAIYCLAGHVDESIKLMNRQLSVTIPSLTPNTEASVKFAQRLLRQYANSPNVDKQNIRTLTTLLHIYTLCRLYKEERYEEVINGAEQYKIVPLDPDTVPTEVERFKLVPEEVGALLSDVSLVLMNSIVQRFKVVPANSHLQQRLLDFSKAILLYSAMIPFRFPTAVNSKLLQLQASIS